MDDATSPAAGVHEICDAYVADCELQPAAATEFSISGRDVDGAREPTMTPANRAIEWVDHLHEYFTVCSLMVRSGQERTRE
jgi:hypothetical protein